LGVFVNELLFRPQHFHATTLFSSLPSPELHPQSGNVYFILFSLVPRLKLLLYFKFYLFLNKMEI